MLSDLESLKTDQEFISIEGLEKKFGILTEIICSYIREKGLPAYTLATSYNRGKADYLSLSPHRYAKLADICWWDNNVESCTAYLMNESEEIIERPLITYYASVTSLPLS